VDRVCDDYQISSFSTGLLTAISSFGNATKIGELEWVRTNIDEAEVLPEVYEEIVI